MLKYVNTEANLLLYINHFVFKIKVHTFFGIGKSNSKKKIISRILDL